MKITSEAVRQARERIAPHITKTRLLRSDRPRAWLKLELEQPTGSFKVRPAFNGMLTHLDEAKARGVLASSSGNFAQAVAYAATRLGVDATIVMPSNTSPFKIERTREFGGKVELSGPSFEERWELTRKLQEQTGRLLLHPYDTAETMEGDATIAAELLEQLSGDFVALIPASGGGMLAGVAAMLKQARPGCRVVGVQPEANGSLQRSFDSGSRVTSAPSKTIADALTATCPGKNTFQLIREYVDEVVSVSEARIREAMGVLHREHGLMPEPGGAVTVAALLSGKLSAESANPRREVVCVVSGGNIQPEIFRQLIS